MAEEMNWLRDELLTATNKKIETVDRSRVQAFDSLKANFSKVKQDVKGRLKDMQKAVDGLSKTNIPLVHYQAKTQDTCNNIIKPSDQIIK